MVYLKWAFWIVVWVLIAAFFHYTLPQHDIARITDTYEKRIDFGENSIFWASPDVGNDTGAVNRDVFFIQAVRTNGRVMVYRNEDTGWGWPPYFKFDTSNLQAEAADQRSTGETRNGCRSSTMDGATNSCRSIPTRSACGPWRGRMWGLEFRGSTS